MWTFAGLLVVAYVLHRWLRMIARALVGTLGIHEAALNRAAERAGLPPVSDDVDFDSVSKRM